ncbi:hypothetical protein AMEX_G18978 [Astyanax mexicanus]|uniref:Uncharacterized protein n=1 Tax=Astyanax mexicanus TaxID=7994 RepID=A0A8T2L8Y2_ASTMX|nr:hypothetical protein AMEX_G18978 [Astyanax mexicanus]
MYDLIMLRRLSSWCKRTSLDHPSNLASYSKELQHGIALHWKISSEVKSMENTKPVAKVKPNKTDEEEESEDSIHLSTEDVSSSHSEYEPNWSESESESSLPPATILPSSQRDKKRKNGMSTTTSLKTSKITVKCTAKTENGKRMWDKKHFCLYCKKPNTKIARHLERKHCNEIDVARALSFPKGSKQRAALLEEIRNKGDFEHNIEVLENGDGQLITWRQPEANARPNDYLPCPQCWGFFVKTDLWKHQISCRVRQVKNMKKTKRIQLHASRLVPVSSSSSGCKAVLQSMQQDDVSICVRNDPLICKFGDVLFEKHGHQKFQHSYIGQKMRELGRFLIAAREIDKSIHSLQDLLMPAKFQTVVNATRTISGFKASQNEYKTPSLACKIGYSLKKAAGILVGESLITGNTSTERDAKTFIEVMETQWNTYVSGRALNTLKTAKWNKDELIPLTEDIMKLQKHLKVLEKDALDGLSAAPNVSDWTKLSQSLLTQIILFNRRREGEASKLLMATYQTRNRTPAHPEVYESLSKLEKSLVNNFTRLEIRGKRERKVPLLLTHEMEASIDLLIRNRAAVEICSENPFVFARTSGTSHIRGSDCLRKFSLECQAKHPERLRSTKLRKHIATLCQMMNLKNDEMDQVAKFMGHDIRVHREYYRLSESTIQLAKISKLLIAIEKGSHTYLGRSLEELNIDEDTLDDEQSDHECTPRQEKQKRSSRTSSREGDLKNTEEDSCGEQQSDHKHTGKPRRSWTNREKEAVWRHLAKHRTLKKVPGKEDCLQCIQAEYALKNRTWEDVKHFVYNTITTEKRKAGSLISNV